MRSSIRYMHFYALQTSHTLDFCLKLCWCKYVSSTENKLVWDNFHSEISKCTKMCKETSNNAFYYTCNFEVDTMKWYFLEKHARIICFIYNFKKKNVLQWGYVWWCPSVIIHSNELKIWTKSVFFSVFQCMYEFTYHTNNCIIS